MMKREGLSFFLSFFFCLQKRDRPPPPPKMAASQGRLTNSQPFFKRGNNSWYDDRVGSTVLVGRAGCHGPSRIDFRGLYP